MSERNILNKTIQYLKKLISKGCKVYYERRQAGGFNYKIGLPDLWFVIDGKHYEIEFKTDKEKIYYRSEQLYWQKKFKELKIDSIISNDFNEIQLFIDEKIKKE